MTKTQESIKRNNNNVVKYTVELTISNDAIKHLDIAVLIIM